MSQLISKWPGSVLPRSLFGRLTLIWGIALLAGHLVTGVIGSYMFYREDRSTNDNRLAKDVAIAIKVLDHCTPSEREMWIARLPQSNYRYVLGHAVEGPPIESPVIKQTLAVLRSEAGTSHILGATRQVPGEGKLPQQAKSANKSWIRISSTPLEDSDIQYNLSLADGTSLAVQLLPHSIRLGLWPGIVLCLQILALAICTWIAVRQATRPLRQLAHAAESLGASLTCEPLSEDGPLEVARAAAAFNAMQRRIVEHLKERIQILAAISHDLQTPITRMRLRADLMDNPPIREKLHEDLDAMQILVEEGIAYARSAHSVDEEPRRINVDALLDSLVCDYVDAGQHISLEGQLGYPLTTRPHALRRMVTNLVDNALKFAGAAEIFVHAESDRQLNITIRDRGPGIPESELLAVLQPFYRLEASRNRNTGGVGLGLAIAQQLALALRADLVLKNREGGGLEARISLPLLTNIL